MTTSWQGGVSPNPFDRTPPPHPGQAPQPPSSDETNTLATLSVVFAFVLAPVGAVLGHLALAEIRRRGERGRSRALVGLTLSYAFTVTAVVVLVVWMAIGSGPGAASTVHSSATTAASAAPKPSTPAPPEPSVTDAGLANLVLTPEEVSDVLKSPGMYPIKTWTQTHELQPGDSFDPAECTDAVFNGLTQSYRDSGYHAVYGLDLGQHTGGFPHGVSEFVATFENISAATNFTTSMVNHMRACGNTRLTYTHGGVSGIYAVGNPSQSGPVTTLRSTLGSVLQNGRPLDVSKQNTSAQRAVATKANVVVDVVVIGRDLGDDDATTIASRIVGRIPG